MIIVNFNFEKIIGDNDDRYMRPLLIESNMFSERM